MFKESESMHINTFLNRNIFLTLKTEKYKRLIYNLLAHIELKTFFCTSLKVCFHIRQFTIFVYK